MKGYKRTSKRITITLSGNCGRTILRGRRVYEDISNTEYVVIRNTMTPVMDIIGDFWNDYLVTVAFKDDNGRVKCTWYSDGCEHGIKVKTKSLEQEGK